MNEKKNKLIALGFLLKEYHYKNVKVIEILTIKKHGTNFLFVILYDGA